MLFPFLNQLLFWAALFVPVWLCSLWCPNALTYVGGAALLAFLVKHAISNLFTVEVQGKTALITGCDSGFGNLVAKRLNKMGMKIIATCLTKEGRDALVAACPKNMQVIMLDVTKGDAINQMAEQVAKQCPDGLDVLINNAGIGQGALVECSSIDLYRRVFEVNYFGLVHITQKMLHLIRKAKGRVINLSSVAGRLAAGGMSAYSGTKFAVEAFSDSLRSEMRKHSVKVSIIEPSWMKTEIINSKRILEVSEKIWSEVPDNIKAVYADDHDLSKAMIEGQFINDIAEDPVLVENAIVHAITSKYPLERYLVASFPLPLQLMMYAPTCVADTLSFLLTGAAHRKAREYLQAKKAKQQ